MEEAAESSCVPPGFRFHPTEEELVGYYLARKVASHKIDLDIIQELDLYRIEPWHLQERCKYAGGGGHGGEEQTEWYFFSYKDRKYPSGTRTNRATAAGFWKATGRDKPVLSSSSSSSPATSRVIGMRKTLVFYKGRAPNGRKTDWIIHEYRLQSNEHAPTQEEGWVVCRAFQKPMPSQQHRLSYGGGACVPGAGGYGYGAGGYNGTGGVDPASSYGHLLQMQEHHHHSHPSSYGARPWMGAAATSTAAHLLGNVVDHALATESKVHFSDMPPPLHSPTNLDGSSCLDADDQGAGIVDWNLLMSSLLPPPPTPAQMAVFGHQQLMPSAAAASSSKNGNNISSGFIHDRD